MKGLDGWKMGERQAMQVTRRVSSEGSRWVREERWLRKEGERQGQQVVCN
jgi:hypothetical protein